MSGRHLHVPLRACQGAWGVRPGEYGRVKLDAGVGAAAAVGRVVVAGRICGPTVDLCGAPMATRPF